MVYWGDYITYNTKHPPTPTNFVFFSLALLIGRLQHVNRQVWADDEGPLLSSIVPPSLLFIRSVKSFAWSHSRPLSMSSDRSIDSTNFVFRPIHLSNLFSNSFFPSVSRRPRYLSISIPSSNCSFTNWSIHPWKKERGSRDKARMNLAGRSVPPTQFSSFFLSFPSNIFVSSFVFLTRSGPFLSSIISQDRIPSSAFL